ncbi:MAG: hypothetical protein FJ335_03020, partial [Sphingomonadales bacterium]|nr:hypothetical protein [Sphingomonadales bacterium]
MLTPVMLGLVAVATHQAAAPTQRMIEKLDRGLVAVPAAQGGGNHVSWRLLATDARGARFVLRRDGRVIARVNGTGATSVHDRGGSATSRYTLEAPGGAGATAGVWAGGYLAIPLDKPADRTTPDGERYSYSANDASVGDLDGDGRYELIVKWYPTIAKDNSQAGYTGETLID